MWLELCRAVPRIVGIPRQLASFFGCGPRAVRSATARSGDYAARPDRVEESAGSACGLGEGFPVTLVAISPSQAARQLLSASRIQGARVRQISASCAAQALLAGRPQEAKEPSDWPGVELVGQHVRVTFANATPHDQRRTDEIEEEIRILSLEERCRCDSGQWGQLGKASGARPRLACDRGRFMMREVEGDRVEKQNGRGSNG